MKRLIFWIPLILLVLLVAMVGFALYKPADRTIESRLIGKSVASFTLPQAIPGKPTVDSIGLVQGRPRLLNIFASWCIPCMTEAPQLMDLARRGVPIDAIAIRDRPEDIAAFLARWGDPYQRIGSDRNSSVQLALGSSGVPETFVVDGRGVIRYQHIGDIRPEDVAKMLAEWEAAR